MKNFNCIWCNRLFERTNGYCNYNKGKVARLNNYCSCECYNQHRSHEGTEEVACRQCNKIFRKRKSYIKKSPNHFCSQSCFGTYNNTHKTYGIRRSKLEQYLEEKLKENYPNFEIHFNRKDAINSELDIYIPSLKLAFELNGIYHYEPIHGPDKLASIKNNDQRKFQACLERGIELCIIDVSGFTHFKEEKGKKFLSIINQIISNGRKENRTPNL